MQSEASVLSKPLPVRPGSIIIIIIMVHIITIIMVTARS